VSAAAAHFTRNTPSTAATSAPHPPAGHHQRAQAARSHAVTCARCWGWGRQEGEWFDAERWRGGGRQCEEAAAVTSARCCGGGVKCDHDAGCNCDAAAAADVRGFALPEASVEGGAVGGGSSLIDPADVVVQVRWDASVDDAQVGVWIVV
jgi:hypothetical protein